MNISFEREVFLSRSFFGGHSQSFDDDDDDHQSSVAPIDLIAFAWMMQRPDGLAGPAALHIQFGVSCLFESI
jgi:hypothetical protein